ncbi:hypothetical protein K9M78_00860 [Candidatus Bipolaricaulota bacterium]|nr:hypothetical protein [Candidatus Bipolaricaulota bacterium]
MWEFFIELLSSIFGGSRSRRKKIEVDQTGSSTGEKIDVEEYKKRRERAEKAGSYKGKHFTQYVEEVKQLKREEKYDEAEKLLRELIKAAEKQASIEGHDPPPWYYRQLKIVQKKKGRKLRKLGEDALKEGENDKAWSYFNKACMELNKEGLSSHRVRLKMAKMRRKEDAYEDSLRFSLIAAWDKREFDDGELKIIYKNIKRSLNGLNLKEDTDVDELTEELHSIAQDNHEKAMEKAEGYLAD